MRTPHLGVLLETAELVAGKPESPLLLTGSQVVMVPPVWGPHLEKQSPRTQPLHNLQKISSKCLYRFHFEKGTRSGGHNSAILLWNSSRYEEKINEWKLHVTEIDTIYKPTKGLRPQTQLIRSYLQKSSSRSIFRSFLYLFFQTTFIDLLSSPFSD